MGLVTFGLGLLNVPGIVMSIFIGLLADHHHRAADRCAAPRKAMSLEMTSSLERHAFKMTLNPGMQAEYRNRHDEIWPELVALLHQAGGSATIPSISTAETNTLFGVLTAAEGSPRWPSLPDHPVMKKWWAHMADIMATNPDNSPVQSDLVNGLPSAMIATSTYRRIAVLDIGKTNAKVVVLDAQTGAEIAAAPDVQYHAEETGPYPHYDIERLWDFVIGALKDFAATPGFDAISITTHGASAVLLAADGSLALPMLDYEHHYPEAVQEAYERLRPPFSETLFAETFRQA